MQVYLTQLRPIFIQQQKGSTQIANKKSSTEHYTKYIQKKRND